MTVPTEPTLVLDASAVPPPDREASPDGFIVEAADGTRIHFLDWGGPSGGGPDGADGPERPDRTDGPERPDGTGGSQASDASGASSSTSDAPGVLLIHGLAQTAWAWTPVARRIHLVRRTVAMDIRGHGLSDAPTQGYDADSLAADAFAVAEGSGVLAEAGGGAGFIVAGHGFGGIVAALVAAALGDRCGGLVLVDGGWEDVAATTGLEPDEFLRGLDEPPEVLRSMSAFLADRRGFDPTTWDDDQEQAARSTVVETYSKRLTPATRPHAIAGCVAAMFEYDPALVLPSVEGPITVLRAADDADGTHARSLAEAQAVLAAAGRPPMRVATFSDAGHNLMRYRPAAVAAAILAPAGTLRP